MPTNIKADALPALERLAAWVRSADMKEYNREKNLLECVDEAREIEARPLMEQLGYATRGHGALLLRICGKASIEKHDDGRTLLFFPLSGDVQVAGEVLEPGTYTKITKTLDLDAQLDCLIVILP
ncbi:uncharacterized protein N7484_000279 [Penicillium longicatenatum]|uniref:uncharacterized protein n=1 Tax=Penicillium longicatenatum TaxID=1561947 RepID=UPI002549B352|nr:uncharacterized protein N7484_000279 [Penicillium longicatenatum]KAJ5660907.1 hypothetical protein N7484_000279 [Penicillium longicatenatum]